MSHEATIGNLKEKISDVESMVVYRERNRENIIKNLTQATNEIEGLKTKINEYQTTLRFLEQAAEEKS